MGLGWCRFAFVLICFIQNGVVGHIRTSRSDGPQVYCHGETFEANCNADEVIFIKSAHYGRTRIGRCIDRDYFMGCSTSVKHLLHFRCSGRHACALNVTDLTQVNTSCPAHADIIQFLDAEYLCLPVVRPDPETCRTSDQNVVMETEGMLPSIITAETGCGSADSPWVIRVKPGQRINITLFDFQDPNSQPPVTCKVQAIVTDPESFSSLTVCAGESGQRHIFMSSGDEAEVRILPQANQFLLQFKAIGCSDRVETVGTWSQREDDLLTVGCTTNNLAWRLLCKDGQWLGPVGECPAVPCPKLELPGEAWSQQDDHSARVGCGNESWTLTCVDGVWDGPMMVECSKATHTTLSGLIAACVVMAIVRLI